MRGNVAGSFMLTRRLSVGTELDGLDDYLSSVRFPRYLT